jgi:hypothetical protein
MKLSTFLSIVAVVGLLFGIAFVAAPVQTLAPYGITADLYTALMARFFGVALFTLGLIIWFARAITDALGRRAFIVGGLVGNIIGFCVALLGQLHEVTNALGWSTVLIYGLFTVGFAYFQFGSQRESARVTGLA